MAALAWRMWFAQPTTQRLLSLATGEEWLPGVPMKAQIGRLEQREGDADGIYGFRSVTRATALAEAIYHRFCYQVPVAVGTVSLWGDAVEHPFGWRAENAYPRSVEWLFGGSASLLAKLRDVYGVGGAKEVTEAWPIGEPSGRAVCVIGPQRSGTSLLAGLLPMLGADTGTRLMDADEYVNPAGFYEDLDLVTLNINLLGALRIGWYAGITITDAHVDCLERQGWMERATHLIRRKTKGRIFGMKDPRMCVLMPFWKRAFTQAGVDVSYIVALRNPLSVAKSMGRFPGEHPGHAAFFWAKHLLEVLNNVQNETFEIIDYDDLLAQPEATIKRLCVSIEAVPWHECRERLVSQRMPIVGLRHWRYSPSDLDGERPIVRDMYEFLSGAAKGMGHDRLAAKIDAWNATFEGWRAEYLEVARPHVLGGEDADLVEKIYAIKARGPAPASDTGPLA